MQITIINVAVSKVKTYQVAEITYSDYRGETKNWKLMSFSNPATFATLKDAKPGESYEVTTGKNDKDYTVWTGATKTQGPAANSAGAVGQGAAPAANGKREWVPDADRQRLIVKQSCLAQAVASLGNGLEVENYIARADEFVAYVYDVPPVEGDASAD